MSVPTEQRPQLVQALDAALAEVLRAKAKHPSDFHSYHEGYAILLEEVDELKAEVWKSKHDRDKLRTEAIHVAAMALRFVSELCTEEPLSTKDQKREELFKSALEYVGTDAMFAPAVELSAQPCGCDMGCKPQAHYCERHKPIEPTLIYPKQPSAQRNELYPCGCKMVDGVYTSCDPSDLTHSRIMGQ